MTDDPAQMITNMVGSIREAVDRLAEQARQVAKQLTPLMCAAKAGDEAAVLSLLKQGADVNAMTENGHTALSQAVSEHHPTIVRLLARHGASLSAGHKGFTDLHRAATLDDYDCASALLDCGADIEAQEAEFGQTPLMEALSEGDADFMGPNVASLLIKCGADVSIKNLSGETALDYVNDYEAAWIIHPDSPWLGASQRALIELVRRADSIHEAERAKEIDAIRVGLEASDTGRVRPLAELAAEMRTKYNLPVHLSDEEIFSGEGGLGSKASQ